MEEGEVGRGGMSEKGGRRRREEKGGDGTMNYSKIRREITNC